MIDYNNITEDDIDFENFPEELMDYDSEPMSKDAKKLHINLLFNRNPKTKIFKASDQELLKITNFSHNKLIEAKKELIKEGYIDIYSIMPNKEQYIKVFKISKSELLKIKKYYKKLS